MSVRILVRGVGGQIVPFVVRKLAALLGAQGHRLTLEETFGMAQRGGGISAVLVVEPPVPVPFRRVLVGLERIEGARGLPQLGAGDLAFISRGVWLPPGPTRGAVPTSDELQQLAAQTGIELVDVDATAESPWPVAQALIGRLPELLTPR